MNKVAILGAGPMGLATAYHLSKQGFHVILFEKDAQPGGMSASFDFDGTTIEKYYHFINLPDHDLFALLHELDMEKELRWVNTKMGFFCQGKLYPWGNPLALLTFSKASFITRLRYGIHAFFCKYIKDISLLDDLSASTWIQKWEGKEGYNKFWRFLFEKKFFSLADPISAAWIASRVRRLANSRKNLMHEQLGYLEGGSFSLIQKLVTEIQSYGGKIYLNAPVKYISLPSKENTAYSIEATGIKEHVNAVISTIPLPYVSNLIELPHSYKKKIIQIQNIGVACVLFRLKKSITQNFWLNIDMPEWDIPGIVEYSNLRPMKATYVYVPFYMPHNHPNWTATDKDLIAKARFYLSKINEESVKTEESVKIFRYEYAQPICTPGFRHILPPYETELTNFFVADTTHSFPEDRSIQESVRIGKELAEKLMTSRHPNDT